MNSNVGQLFKRLIASAEQVAAEEERIVARQQKAATLIEDAHDRTRGTFTGIVRSVVFNPEHDKKVLEVELYDGSGALALVWLGRRSISGIIPGSRMTVNGLVTIVDGRPVMYNPRYELKAKTGEL
ncbi:OB-fold nucleic acid binding domain-containing protein [Timonella sp. A28]|uniref:OB-fold nucleic acid binding domain-containing protein n=1 Tax=Timonella sp. A28 TaxID=3442640 RepID=UPI003EBED442